MITSETLPRRHSFGDGTLQLAVAAMGLVLHATALVAIKWWVYPGWTWRGYLTDLKAIVGLTVFAAGLAAWLFRLYRTKTLEEAARDQIRGNLQGANLRPIAAALSVTTIAVISVVLWTGEREVAVALLADAQQSNWKHAREELGALSTQPLRPDLSATFKRFVDVHDLSERDQLKESRSLRQDRLSVSELIQSGHDYHGLNSLTFAELSKGFFVEDAENPKHWLVEGVEMLMRQSERLSEQEDRAALLARAGELNLAGKDYLPARDFFQRALPLEKRPTAIARIRANIGNTFAAAGDTGAALRLYSEAEARYPEGRRSIFYSNYGYLLMLAKDYESAKVKVAHALQIDPEDWYSYLNLGLIKEALDEYDDAAADFRIVIEKSSNPDSKREARIFAGRCLELDGREPAEYLGLYLAAAGRAANAASINRLLGSPNALSNLYSEMATSLEKTNTHAIEKYIQWFRIRAIQAGSQMRP